MRQALVHAGLLVGPPEPAPVGAFCRRDGSPGRVDRHADVLHSGPPPAPEVPLVVQVSRWDRMKDMTGVMVAFTEQVAPPHCDAHLLLAGPAVTGVADDPEGAQVLDECGWRPGGRSRTRCAAGFTWRACRCGIRRRTRRWSTRCSVTPRSSPRKPRGRFRADRRGSDVEAPAVVGSGVGGIADQLVDEETGLLVADPGDLGVFAARCGRSAHERAYQLFLADRHGGSAVGEPGAADPAHPAAPGDAVVVPLHRR